MQIQNFAIGQAIPDLTFFIDIPLEEIEKRKVKIKGVELDRIEVSNSDFYRKVREGYLNLTKSETRFRRIDGTESIEKIHIKILNILEKYINTTS